MALSSESGPLFPADFHAETLRGRPGGFRVARSRAGQWWLIDPHDRPVVLRAVGEVNRHAGGTRRVRLPEFAPLASGEPAAFARETTRRLLGWGFNTLGPGADPDMAGLGLHQVVDAGFLRAGGPLIRSHGVVLPDVFDSSWPARCDVRAEAIASWCLGRRELVGIATDTGLVWEPAALAGGMGLLQICLGLEPTHAAHHAAWEFVAAFHGGDLAGVGRVWGLALPHRETIRQLTLSERCVDSPAHREDDRRFVREFARRYFHTAVEALRRHDPEHLVLGARFDRAPADVVLGEAVACQVDLMLAPAGFDPGDHPCVWCGVGLPEGQGRPALADLKPGVTRLERRLAKLRREVGEATLHPSVVGYEWARWSDEVGDAAPFGPGLVRLDGTEAREHTELMVPFNVRAESRRARAQTLGRPK